jgi:hypothetical protein
MSTNAGFYDHAVFARRELHELPYKRYRITASNGRFSQPDGGDSIHNS